MTRPISKIMVVIATSVSFIMTSCEKNIPQFGKEKSSVEINGLTTYQGESELIQSLQSVNKGFHKESEARFFGKKFLKFCSIATADVLGGYQMGVLGGKVGAFLGPKGAVVGAGVAGAIGAIGSSYGAYVGIESAYSKTPQNTHIIKVENSPLDVYLISDVYAKSIKIDSAILKKVPISPLRNAKIDNDIKIYNDGINLNFPKGDIGNDAIKIGRIHNIALELLTKADEINIPKEFSVIPKSDIDNICHYITSSPEYIERYKDCVDSAIKSKGGNSMFKELKKTSDSKIDVIMSLFTEVFNEYPESVEDVNKLVNAYISKIEHSKELSESEKRLIYNSLSVSAHSYSYWENNLDVK